MMNNRDFTNLIKRASKGIYWDDDHKVTVGYALTYGYDYARPEYAELIDDIQDELDYRFNYGVPLTVTQKSLLD